MGRSAAPRKTNKVRAKMTTALPKADRLAALPALGETGWRAVPNRDALRKIWKFRSFSEAWAFMTRAALAAEKLNHHPEWSNRYNVVDVVLITHDCNGLSHLDITLAQAMDRFAGEASVIADHSDSVSSLLEATAPKLA